MKTEIDTSRITDLVLGKLTSLEAAKLMDEIANDPRLSEALELAVKIYDYSQGDGRELFAYHSESEGESLWSAREWLIGVYAQKGRRRIALSLAALISIFFIFLVMKIMLIPPDALQDPNSYWISWASQRNSASSDLVEAQLLVDEGKYGDALKSLERHMRAYPKDPLLGQIQYNSAVLVLLLSRNTIIGLRYSTDQSMVRSAIDLLDSVLSGQSPTPLKDRARLLRAKALVSIGQDLDALDDLRQLAGSGGDCQVDAIRLIETITNK